MKRISRLTALLLALMMLLSIPVSAMEGVPKDDLTRIIWDEWANDGGDGEAPPSVPGDDFGDGDPSTSPVDAPAYAVTEYVTLAQSAEGSEAEKAATLNRYGKLVLESGIESGRWQVLVGDQWINISTEASASFEVTYAKVESLLAMNGFIKVRCISADGAEISEIANLTVSYDLPSLPAAEPQKATYSARSASARAVAADDDPETVVVEIAYQYLTGEAVDSSYVAQIGKGGDLTTNVITLPKKEGYVASYVTPTDGATFTAPTATDPGSIKLTLQNVTADIKYVVTYVPDFVDYTVEHYLMGFDADQSTAVKQDADTKVYSKVKKTGDQVGKGVTVDGAEVSYENSYEGYTALWYDDSTAVAADGSTVIKIYYERNWYLMLFNLGGGYGVEPIYAQYGAPVTIETPKRAGYTFDGWTENEAPATVPATMPAGNKTYTAIWKVGDPVNYTVVYWKENADDAGYSFWGQVTRQATVETVVNGSDDIPVSITTAQVDGKPVNEKPYFTYNAAKTEQNVVVKGDGSTVVNVYYYRNTYTLYFMGIDGKCAIDEHTHNATCDSPCTKLEHKHTDICGQESENNVIHVITAKYDQNIGNVWPTADKFPDYNLKGWRFKKADGSTDDTIEIVSKRINMTSDLCDTQNKLKTLVAQPHKQEQYLNYMFESFDQTSPANGTTRILRKGIYYDRSALYSQTVNSGSSSWQLKQIYGMTPAEKDGNNKNPDYKDEVSYNNSKYWKNVYLYYNRNRSNLMYHNVDDVVKTVSDIMFEQPLGNYKDSDGNLLRDYVPPYPGSLEEDAYEFEGWYTTPECYEGTRFNFDTATMPNGNYTIYAKWVPVTRHVRVYPSEADKIADTNQIGETITVLHGEMVPENKHPETPENGNYDFVGWFYRDEDGNEKAFDFDNMPVRKDLDIYAKWSSNTPVPFTIYYRLANEDGSPYIVDGNYVNVAAPLVSQALPGYTVTVDAKTGSDLYADYREGYFPKPPSHSVIIDVETTNEYTFWYTPAQVVPYRVVYLEDNGDGTYKKLVDDKLVEDNVNVVVTENYVRIPGYMPDAYQKRLIVSYPGGTTNDNGNNKTDPDLGENIIFFYYSRDYVNAYWTVTHYIQPVDGSDDLTTWQQYGATESQTGQIGAEYTATQKTIPGFTYHDAYVDQYTAEGTKTETNVKETLKAELTGGGMDFRLYYKRNEYPIKVQYLEQGTNVVLADPELYNSGATYDYQSQQSVSASKAISGYTLVSANPQTITIQVDGSELTTIEKNVVTFYYKKTEIAINYVGVAPDGTLITTDEQKASIGSVSPEAEPGTNGIVTAVDGPVAGSTATAKTNYKFVGWYLDAACTQAVPEAWVTGSKIVPQKNSTTNLYETATYYAKFDYDTSTLTIKKTGMAANEAAMFTVTVGGKTYKVALNKDNGFTATISGLTVGSSYTIVEDGNWSWRYKATAYTYTGKDASGNPIIVAGGSEVEVTNSPKTDKWLSDEDSVINFLPPKSKPDGGEQ